ncbi:MAG: phosphoribosylformylglycinamidine synthase [Ruminococcus sp.]|jgi:phosphoribosylformylglycinamidine synthase|nr:phosphoribosylformylglycinamidine synthase [Ruminococcus sp.]
MMVYRIYVEKKKEFAAEAAGLLEDLRAALDSKIKKLRIINRYDADLIDFEDFNAAADSVFSEPAVDNVYAKLPEEAEFWHIFAVEYLPGQFDQRADSCAQCIQIMTGGERPRVRFAKIYMLDGSLSAAEYREIKNYLINPVESREASLEEFETLETKYDIPTEVEILTGFITMPDSSLGEFIAKYSLAMDEADLRFCRDYFAAEHRDPTLTELRMIDTYWSDHCRHTTFLTNLHNVSIPSAYIRATYDEYIKARETLGRSDKPLTLMDLATIGAKELKAKGVLKNLDESEEINACSIKIKVDVNGVQEDYLLMFKNETHNHPTEIEPFGGAATCLGGAIRDPLSGRSYVYQAMRVTGAANPLVPVSDTMRGKLPQRKITVGAANGYSSYGNQIGLATGQVTEIYHAGYAAKRMEIGAVIGAAPEKNVRRERPEAGDIIILLGGKTGRDGCGGATGSSKAHSLESLETCGAEVQKGNAPEERKLQRLFRNPEVTAMIKRCNDFGAGGVSVAIGELADGLVIDLSKVPKKYDGLDGTELAISESQERMAVAVAAADAGRFIDAALNENLEATVVAAVTAEPRLRMVWNGKTIVDVSRDFLNSNGAPKHTSVSVEVPLILGHTEYEDEPESFYQIISNLNVCSQKGLVERFDSTVGAATVTMPYGGRYQLTPEQAMTAKIPVPGGETSTASIMAFGYNPYLSEKSPYLGAISAVIESAAKVIAAGGRLADTYLTFQEYFERTKNDPKRWGKPLAALLGAYKAQIALNIAAIGGKDSMSGSFENLDVPPTLVSFAVAPVNVNRSVSGAFKTAGSKVLYLAPKVNADKNPDFESVKSVFAKTEELIASGVVNACYTSGFGGVAEAVMKMSFGNHIGFKFTVNENDSNFYRKELFHSHYGAMIIEVNAVPAGLESYVIGETIPEYRIVTPNSDVDMEKVEKLWASKLEPVFPTRTRSEPAPVNNISVRTDLRYTAGAANKTAKPRVLIPVFPGTNGEYDAANAFDSAGAESSIFVIKNITKDALNESVKAFEKAIRAANIIMLPGGFSGGDEPDGAAKFITAIFKNPAIKDAVTDLLERRDGLMLGICNGFQALIKLGLIEHGKIMPQTSDSPTLTFNTIGRHQSMVVDTRISSDRSPWLYGVQVGDIISVPISHGEGRFVAPSALVAKFAENGQVCAQYVDVSGNATGRVPFNPNTSMSAVEALCSPSGRVLGKMGHSERVSGNTFKNVPGNFDSKIFISGVNYFK